MSAVAKAIWYIESQFQRDVSLDDVSAMAGMSKFQLSRTFTSATGYTINAYLRGRRLTEAARVLADGARDILAVALQFGYGSHEAFTRAFREHFGTTPEAVRRAGTLAGLPLVEPMTVHTGSRQTVAPPAISREPERRLVGLAARHASANAAGIPSQWQQLQPYLGDGPEGGSYGIIGDYFDDGSFDYFCGYEIASHTDIPDGLVAIRMPAQRFARFRHPGHVTTIRATIYHAFAVWLPASGEEMGGEFTMVERYGGSFDGRTGYGPVEVWLGLAG